MSNIEFVDLDQRFETILYQWRTRPSVERVMGRRFSSDYASHLVWCHSVQNDASSINLIALVEEEPIAYCSLTDAFSKYPISGFVLGDERRVHLCKSVLTQFYSFLWQEKKIKMIFGYISRENKNMAVINQLMGWQICCEREFVEKVAGLGLQVHHFNLIQLDLNNGRY